MFIVNLKPKMDQAKPPSQVRSRTCKDETGSSGSQVKKREGSLNGQSFVSNRRGMTSVAFQINDPSGVRILHGQRADGYLQRREQERNEGQARQHSSHVNEHGRGVTLTRDDTNSRGRTEDSGINNRGRNSSSTGAATAQFLAAGGRLLDLDRIDYEDLYRLFPSHAPRGAGSDVIEQCSSVFT
jgi:hypothetical protein